MYRLISKLVIYREFEKDSILARLSDICETFYSGEYDRDALITQIYTQMSSNRIREVYVKAHPRG